MDVPEYEYAAFEKCGCLVGLLSEDITDQKFISRTITRWVKEGCTVKRINFSEVRNLLEEKGFGCKCNPEDKKLVEKNNNIRVQPGLFEVCDG